MTQEELVATYWAGVDDAPDLLADLYLDFHDFDGIEFVMFKNRLSSAILVSRSARAGNSQLATQFEEQRRDGSHRVPGWEEESDIVLGESIDVVDDAQAIAIGATILSAVTALELLLKELSPEEGGRGGLDRNLRDFLARYEASADEEARILEMTSKVRRRRNDFAHTLTGSHWISSLGRPSLTSDDLEDTLFKVAEIAIEIEGLVKRGRPRP